MKSSINITVDTRTYWIVDLDALDIVTSTAWQAVRYPSSAHGDAREDGANEGLTGLFLSCCWRVALSKHETTRSRVRRMFKGLGIDQACRCQRSPHIPAARLK